jgi:hypothetical protein
VQESWLIVDMCLLWYVKFCSLSYSPVWVRGAGIKVSSTDAPRVAKALAQYRAGKLTEAKTADVEGHWL